MVFAGVLWVLSAQLEEGRAAAALEAATLSEQVEDLAQSNTDMRAALASAEAELRAARGAMLAGGRNVASIADEIRALPSAERAALLRAAGLGRADPSAEELAEAVDALPPAERAAFWVGAPEQSGFVDWVGGLTPDARLAWLARLPEATGAGAPEAGRTGGFATDPATRYEVIRTERDIALAELEAVRAERDELTRQLAPLVAERDRLRAEESDWAKARELLNETLRKLAADQAAADAEVLRLTNELARRGPEPVALGGQAE